MAKPHYVSETQILREIANNPDCRLIWTDHVLEKMIERGITEADIEEVLTKGQVVLMESTKKDILWRIEGSDIDGRRLTVLAAVFRGAIKIKVVTSFAGASF